MRINRKGQITIPARLRGELGLQAGDYITFTEVDGEVYMVPRKNVAQPSTEQDTWHDGGYEAGGGDAL